MTMNFLSFFLLIKSYRASGTFVKTCGEDGKWRGDDDGICISKLAMKHSSFSVMNFQVLSEYPTPKLICPPNRIVELPPFSDEVEVKLQRPKTDLHKRDVTMKPSWIRDDKVVLRPGALNITYIAKHPISKLTTSCTTTIYVDGELNFAKRSHVAKLYSSNKSPFELVIFPDGEPPTVDFCPPTQKHKIAKHHDSIKVNWTEPKFSDNVQVAHVAKTNVRRK